MKIAICGYGNLGRGVECAVRQNPDMELTGVYTRRDPASITTLTGVPVYSVNDIEAHKAEIDVLILCGGSAKDLPETTPAMAKLFNVVDSFDHHAHIPAHFAAVDASAKAAGTVALISAGWDPGLFSMNRLLADCFLPDGTTRTFWGTGVSQGHSDAIRRIPGVADARQYTVPVEETLNAVRAGSKEAFTARQMHRRVCYVVLKEGADAETVKNAIVTMPDYFEPYDTEVNFITMDELKKNHSGLPHGGFVIRSGSSGLNGEHKHTIEYSLQLDSNPEFTSLVLTACARAVYRMAQRGYTGAASIFDIAPADLSPLSREGLLAKML